VSFASVWATATTWSNLVNKQASKTTTNKGNIKGKEKGKAKMPQPHPTHSDDLQSDKQKSHHKVVRKKKKEKRRLMIIGLLGNQKPEPKLSDTG